MQDIEDEKQKTKEELLTADNNLQNRFNEIHKLQETCANLEVSLKVKKEKKITKLLID